ncbi:MAG: peptidase M14 carboxypeptidase A, partial [bacterium]
QYRPGVPSPDAFLGWPLGQRFTPHARIIDYMTTLTETGPDRCRWESYGRTWEDRPLGYLVISSPANLGRLDAIKSSLAALADPEQTSRKDAARLAKETPAVVWFSYNVHGNEASTGEAAMAVAYELVGGTGPEILSLLDSLVVILDPCLNPDGRDRYVSWQMQAVGRQPDPTGSTWEHAEPWPGGRYNHYLFDLNRDWAWLSQPESRGRVGAYRQWHPQVHVDFHEMYPNSSYFFFPAAEPIHVQLPQQVRYWADIYGRGNAEAFDRHAWSYFTAESFDLLYPGYGDSWPSLQGATGMTYEQAGHGLAGRAFERPDGTILTLRERLRHHVGASLATLATTRRHREARLIDFHAFFDDAVNRQPDATLAYILPPVADEGRRQELVELLLAHGIRVERATGELKAPGTRNYDGEPLPASFPAGTYVVPGR